MLGPATLLYEAEAALSPAGNPMDPQRWQVVCHHGAAYALDVTWKATLAQAAGRAGHFGTWTSFYPDNANSGWASFYWNLRYFVGKGASAPTERVLIVDLQKLLDA